VLLAVWEKTEKWVVCLSIKSSAQCGMRRAAENGQILFAGNLALEHGASQTVMFLDGAQTDIEDVSDLLRR